MPNHGPLREVVIEKEDAIFWMDKYGRWYNDGGRFEHRKIIDYFNSAIRRDDKGYFVCQTRGDVIEKVYFRYEDTPLFAVDVRMNETTQLVLNNKEVIPLDPSSLFVCQDNLYMKRDEDRIKLTDRVLIRLATKIEYDGERYAFVDANVRYDVPER